MQTHTNLNRTEIKERDGYREQCFKDVYDIQCKIQCTNVTDPKWNWIRNDLKFTDAKGSVYKLIEYFKEGDDNSTDHVDLEYLGSAGIIHTERFSRHLDAELRMVSLIRENINGNS